MTHALLLTDLTSDQVIVWSRANAPGQMRVVVEGPGDPPAVEGVIEPGRDHTARAVVRGLRASSTYQYRVSFRPAGGGMKGPPFEGEFHTAPATDEASAVTFAFGGDLGGQNVCRDAEEGYGIFRSIAATNPDFFIGLGDMIYGDGVCEETGLYGNEQVAGDFEVASEPPGYWAHWRYNRDDPAFRELAHAAPYYAIWDDHEVVNDFGPHVPLMSAGLQAFLDYNPVTDEAHRRLYRAFRWGTHLDLIFLDTRQHRAPNALEDRGEEPKTMLGRAQRSWLLDRVRQVDATWRVIVSSVPISIPTGRVREGRDGWANHEGTTGFEREFLAILGDLRDAGVTRLLFITTDVHFASAFRYRPFDDDFVVHELVTGPLNAGLFPKQEFDQTLNPERLFFHGPTDDLRSWQDARWWMNFGVVHVDAEGRLTYQVRDIDGEVLFENDLSEGSSRQTP
ncbi:MAG: alkaline phosphatase D family protein [Myxococcota bacterium]